MHRRVGIYYALSDKPKVFANNVKQFPLIISLEDSDNIGSFDFLEC